jgi:D-alanyl-D-alanine carboxypeptidase
MLQTLASIVALLAAPSGQPAFDGSSEPIDGHMGERIVGNSWHEGCPVGLGKLRLLRVDYWGFDDAPHRGRLVVNRRFDEEIIAVMRRLYRLRYPIRRMRLIDRYGADDHRSMAADNTSAFNCRFVAGTNRWSMHSYGLAIDLNPVENPYVHRGVVEPPAGRRYLDRAKRRRGMVVAGGAVVRAFAAIGWPWGGHWTSSKDYQHFSATGR